MEAETEMAGTKADESERIFQGTVLVTALIEHYPRCFHSRGAAEAFAQRLLETGHLTSIHAEDGKFQDSAFYYRWSNDSLFEDITLYSNNIIDNLHIPEKRLSDLIAAEMERERGDGGPYQHRRYNSTGDSDDDFRSSTPRTMALRQQYQESNLSVNDMSHIQSRDSHGQHWNTPVQDRNQNYYCNNGDTKHGAFRKLDFDKMQQENERLRSDSKSFQPSFDHISGQNRAMSDYEKQLLDDMKRMQSDHEKVVRSYEDRITELMNKMHELRNIAELLEQAGARSNPTSPWHSQDQLIRDRPQNGRLTPEGMLSKAETESPSRRPPPPVPAPPPMTKVVEPTKPPVRPRVKMRQLFWNRLILPKKNKHKKTIWQDISEAHVDIDEFEKLFGKQEKKTDAGRNRQSLADREKRKSWAKFEGAKILEQNRSRTVAIKIRSMHCQLEEIKAALYNVDFDTVSIESLQGLYQIRATDEELKQMEHYLRSDGLLPLDEPEQFLYEVSRLCHFKERLSCIVFTSKFNETMFNMDQQLLSMQDACQMLTKTSALKTILELVLTLGNYMNGGTQRGQADGFRLEFLNKIKDVKSVQNNFNLLQFIVRIYCRDNEEDAGQNTAKFRLPDPSVIRQAAQVSLSETSHELIKMQDKVQAHKVKAEIVAKEAPRNLVQPFKDKMADFFSNADNTLKRLSQKLQETIRIFEDTTNYLVCDDMVDIATNGIPVTDKFMSTWFTFLVDCKHYWKLEHKTIAKENFERVERRKRERKASVVRVSTSERNLNRLERRTSLKEKFQKKMVDNDSRAIQVKEMYKRGDTPVQLGYDSRVSSMASLTNGRSETPPVIKEETPQKTPEPESAFQPFQRTSALRSSLQARKRRRREAEMIPHVAEANPNIELKEPMTLKDTLGGKNAVWSARPTVQDQDVPVARVNAAVIHQEAQHNLQQGQTPQGIEMSSRRGREMSPAIRRRRAASPPQEARQRELSPQGGNRREMSPPPPPVGPRRHRSPPAVDQRSDLSQRDRQDHRRDRTPTRNDRRREVSPQPAQNESRRELSPGGMNRRRELSPVQPDRRRELSPNNRLPPRRDMSPPHRSPREPPIMNGSADDIPPPIPRRDRSPAHRRELSPAGDRSREHSAGHRQRTRVRSPPTQDNRREISPPPVVRRRDRSPAVSSIPVRRRDPSPAHTQGQRGQASAERGRAMSPGRQEVADAQEAQRLRAAAERYTSSARRSMSPPDNGQAPRSRRLPETPHSGQKDYQHSPPHNTARVDSPSPPPIPPLPPDIEEQIASQQNRNNYANDIDNRPCRSPVGTAMKNTDRYLGRAIPLSERQIQEKSPVRGMSPRVIMATTVNERLQKYENKVKRTKSLRMDSISSRPDVQSRPRNRAPILDNLRQLEEKLQTEISQRDVRVSDSDYQPAIRSRRYAAKLVRSPTENGEGEANPDIANLQDPVITMPRRRRPHSYHSLEGSHVLGQFEQQTQQQYNNPTPVNSNGAPEGQHEYQNALRSASLKYNQNPRPAKT
ncbi:FH2 domain-containing protein 1-like isoform X2 [Lineus longissimus]|uniref:FH2 domain-containing protein 1-like isoform X2 n=1 Tax=Lineus longissimus TaxID=88925 RepID=UPI00315CAE8C